MESFSNAKDWEIDIVCNHFPFWCQVPCPWSFGQTLLPLVWGSYVQSSSGGLDYDNNGASHLHNNQRTTAHFKQTYDLNKQTYLIFLYVAGLQHNLQDTRLGDNSEEKRVNKEARISLPKIITKVPPTTFHESFPASQIWVPIPIWPIFFDPPQQLCQLWSLCNDKINAPTGPLFINWT